MAVRAAAPPAATMSGRIHREVVILLGWGAAILLQLAHPLVARGVHDHSGFRTGWLAPWRRLHRTLDAMLTLTFGTEAEAERVVRGINAVHDRVEGRLPAAEGPYPAGTRYSAHDPELLAWVHATCLHAFVGAYERFVAPLTPEERDRYCAEASAVEPRLGLPAGRLPRSWEALQAYLDAMLAGGAIAVGPTARRLAAELLEPPGLRWVRPVVWGLRLVTAGLLPPAVREGYGLPWDRRRQVALDRLAALVRGLVRLAPSPLRHFPRARRVRPAAGGGGVGAGGRAL